MDPNDTRAPLSPVVAAALAQRQGERAEDALCAEADRMLASRQDGPATGLDRLTDGVLLARRAAGPTIGDEFAITRELARRRRREIERGLAVLKAMKHRATRAKGGH